VPLGALEPLDDIRMVFMDVGLCLHLIYPVGEDTPSACLCR
jgi:hypothetical protein